MSDDSPSCARNPSPPPELQENTDLFEAGAIRNTTFSKHWLFSTLMKLIEEVDKENDNKEVEEGGNDFSVDVDEELQNELCELWDMSMNSEVVQFLHEFKAIDIFVGVIGKSKAPRVTEICVGILGNMACDETVCVTMSENEKVRSMALLLLDNSDPQTLNETTRFLYTSLSNPAARGAWIEAITQSENIQDHINFIFQSSTNCDLLHNTAEFLDVLLDVDEELCEKWATPLLIQSMLEAIKQIGCKHSDVLETYLHIFQLLSTTETGVESLVECADGLCPPLIKYLGILCEDEIVGLEGREAAISSALSVLNVIFTSHDETAARLLKDEKLLRIFLKILEPLMPYIHQINAEESVKETEVEKESLSAEGDKKDTEAQPSSSADNIRTNEKVAQKSEDDVADDDDEMSEKTKRHLMMLYRILQGFAYDVLFSIHMAMTEEEESLSSEMKYKNLFSYLNESVSRLRLNYFITALKDSANESFNPIDTLKTAANKLKLDRLGRIIQSVLEGRCVSRENSDGNGT
ncbi:protein saal1-like [Saccostrea echinata]|uniref:protein saal1-like n=1 Tax=Saccostrea echinata TaxID=191078 RepID=UPI002A815808|nr:protein saal1-like [Saccostrea echinata]